jgi:hypothetical protein
MYADKDSLELIKRLGTSIAELEAHYNQIMELMKPPPNAKKNDDFAFRAFKAMAEDVRRNTSASWCVDGGEKTPMFEETHVVSEKVFPVVMKTAEGETLIGDALVKTDSDGFHIVHAVIDSNTEVDRMLSEGKLNQFSLGHKEEG